jgi:hypothetical protein
MSYAMLWIETLAVVMLWDAMWTAIAAHASRKFVSGGTVLIAGLIPLAFLACDAALAGFLKFAMHLETNWFTYALSAFIVAVVGSVVVLFRGTRRVPPAGQWASAAWPRARLAAGLFAAVAVTAMTLWNMDLEVRQQAAMTGLEAGATMVSVAPPPLADSRNAALIYEKAFARLRADPACKSGDSVLGRENVDVKSPEVQAFLEHHAPTIKLLRQAAELPDCRFDQDYAHPSISMLLPELNECRGASRLLQLHLRSELAQGRIDSAIEDLRCMLHIAQAAGSEPILVSALVSIAVEADAFAAMQSVLPAVSKAEQLKDFAVGDAASDVRMLVRSLRGEEAFELAVIADVGTGKVTYSQFIAMLGGLRMGLTFVPPCGFPERIFLLPAEADACRSFMEGYQTMAAQPYYQAKPRIDEMEKTLRIAPRTLLVSLIVPALSRGMISFARIQAMHADAEVALAATRYRLDRGSLPFNLLQLQPDYLDDIPTDPFDGKPLRLTQKDGQWIAYSVGPDQTDDGGAEYDSKTQKGDVRFVLK